MFNPVKERIYGLAENFYICIVFIILIWFVLIIIPLISPNFEATNYFEFCLIVSLICSTLISWFITIATLTKLKYYENTEYLEDGIWIISKRGSNRQKIEHYKLKNELSYITLAPYLKKGADAIANKYTGDYASLMMEFESKNSSVVVYQPDFDKLAELALATTIQAYEKDMVEKVTEALNK